MHGKQINAVDRHECTVVGPPGHDVAQAGMPQVHAELICSRNRNAEVPCAQAPLTIRSRLNAHSAVTVSTMKPARSTKRTAETCTAAYGKGDRAVDDRLCKRSAMQDECCTEELSCLTAALRNVRYRDMAVSTTMTVPRARAVPWRITGPG